VPYGLGVYPVRTVIPIKDLNPPRTTPHVTYVLVTLNIVVFMYELLLGAPVFGGAGRREFQEFVFTWGAIPREILISLLRPGMWSLQTVGTLFTSMFLHGDVMHLLGNMLFLYIFGDNVEDALGHVRYFFFYMLTGLGAALLHILLNATSPYPMVGASGAVSGLLGAYIILFPHARVLTLVIFFFITLVEIPAYWFIAIWFGLQLLGGLGGSRGIAFWAHVGGFLAGLGFVRLWLRRYRRTWWNG
jgi:membrane associated rhomboid family serine protease